MAARKRSLVRRKKASVKKKKAVTEPQRCPWMRAWSDTFCELVMEIRGVEYSWEGARDGIMLKKLYVYARGNLETFTEVARKMLLSENPWFVEQGISLSLLHSQWNRLRTSMPCVNRNVATIMRANAVLTHLKHIRPEPRRIQA